MQSALSWPNKKWQIESTVMGIPNTDGANYMQCMVSTIAGEKTRYVSVRERCFTAPFMQVSVNQQILCAHAAI